MSKHARLTRFLTFVLVTVFAALILSSCGGGSSGEGSGGGTLTLVAYSTPREAYEQITSTYAETEAGQGVSFETSFGSSGEQSRAVEGGLPADVIALSLEPDVTRLIEPGLVEDDWNADEYNGMVTDSVVVLAVRPGNLKGIQGWSDLVREDVEVITPNPFTSGGARWNVMAAYGAQLEQGASEDEAIGYLRQLFTNVSVQDKSARESLQTFAGGKGDVLIAYENEIITAQQEGEELEFVVPEQTILIENPVAVISDSQNPDQAQAFVDFLRSPESQRIFGEQGYRPVVEEVLGEFDYPTPPSLFTIEDLGGWQEVTTRFFNADSGVMADINREVGAPTG
ncbi:MAG: Sulfate and thiosulfate binding protein CysP [uncultured Rubrobacteraceae bacterium]|uniref:Sulfate and thiosulfate binding protein CysP n=1 Tax=uncultured Rubrobacteraceae bacterium TaxID=349277 RepID=A0A6J4R2B6_9ACTN|nr:MAG: Sulfate and thiosulfate binding protein CysP [uncultured Rubrobacteraceae bacterium]